jgi:hypothetical protein
MATQYAENGQEEDPSNQIAESLTEKLNRIEDSTL